MCEQTHVGCPDCATDTSQIVAIEERQERVSYRLDEAGSIDYDTEPDYGEAYCEDAGYECEACGWRGSSLDDEAVDESCECEQCVEPDPEDEGPDPDKIVVLHRVTNELVEIGDDWPQELIALWADRATNFQPLPRWRAAEIQAEFLTGTSIPVVVNFDFPIPDESTYEMILPGFDPAKPNYVRKEPNDAGDVGSSSEPVQAHQEAA
jgi:hypothetical protein